ncbi:MAG: hypothetical protein M1817_006036 [Caeruleum heppii]|nr:MAG: hypothetical protein M1817_006036 [Caeruleum heppii]
MKGQLRTIVTYMWLSENVVSARDHLVTTSAGHITSTHVSLLDTLSETASAFRDHRARYQTQTDELVRPLGEEQILLTTASKSRGKEESVVSLASRVERFRGVLRDTESELERQWREWDEVQREILGVAGEMIGVEAVEAILKGGTTPQTKRVGSHVKDEVDEELERATERLRREIAALTEETMKTSDEMDKELDIKAKQERQKIMSLVSEIGA